ncbi:MAG: efflux RND transporter periplasmic adaptor subunit [Marinifilaceae bacterium]|nr:efflux RND transporter periplasmic adaptor subunit [Marinifilaceae bacterium]
MKFKRFLCNIRITLVLFLVISVYSCTNNSQVTASGNSETLPEEKNQVEIIVLHRDDFTREIISNGKLAASQKAELYFKTDGIIETIDVKNGQKIKIASNIASLENEDLKFKLRQTQMDLEKAEIEKKDALLSMGYKDVPESRVQKDHLRTANIRSGYNDAVFALEKAETELEKATLKAPFNGIVEGIKQKPYEKTNLSEPFCTLINADRFTIDFPLLETEINEVKLGQKVTVSPITGAEPSNGIISEINPRIDENGLAWLKAEVVNPGMYMEGMNVKVSIKKAIPNQLIVPKQAVVLRQNREVLFRYTKGTAYWTYVNVLDENEKQYSVEAAEGATLNPGDTIIISNNLNLAHESEVEIE